LIYLVFDFGSAADWLIAGSEKTTVTGAIGMLGIFEIAGM
jgi:hypothetical protein